MTQIDLQASCADEDDLADEFDFDDVQELQMQLFRVALVPAHVNSKIRKQVFWEDKNQIYSIGDDKRVAITDIDSRERIYELKLANL